MQFKKGHIPWIKGKKHSEEAKRKMSKTGFKKGHKTWNKGIKGIMKPNSTSFEKGHKTWNKGLAKETDERVRKSATNMEGRIVTKETRKKLSNAISEKHSTGMYRPHLQKLHQLMKGHIVTKETRKKIGTKNKISQQTHWKNLTESEKKKKTSAPHFFKKGHKHPAETIKKMKDYANTPENKEKFRQRRMHQTLPRKDTKIEVKMQKLLKKNDIEFTTHKPIIGQPDVFIKPNICIFADGDYWHANPKSHNPDSPILSSRGLKPAYKIWEKDEKINQKLIQKGYNVLRLWEDDIKNNPEKCLQKIIKAIKESKPKI